MLWELRTGGAHPPLVCLSSALVFRKSGAVGPGEGLRPAGLAQSLRLMEDATDASALW